MPLARSTTRHRAVEATIPGTTSFWNVSGLGHFPITGPLPQGTTILEHRVNFQMTTVDFVTGGVLDVPLGADPMNARVQVGVWADLFVPGSLPPDPVDNSDPGWLSQGHMEVHGPYPALTNGHTTELYWHWRLAREELWYVNRKFGPVDVGTSGTVYWVWNNTVLVGPFDFDVALTGHSINTSGRLSTSVLTRP